MGQRRRLSSRLFRIPDLRGVFLRGADGDERDDQFREPDNNQRTRLYTDTNVPSNAVGSFQTDAAKVSGLNGRINVFLQRGGKGVEHGVGDPVKFSQGDYVNAGRNVDIPVTFDSNNSETRPSNAYVHFIIKVQ